MADELGLINIADLIGGIAQGRARGGSRLFKFNTAPQDQTIIYNPDGFRRVTGMVFATGGGINFAMTKNSMSHASLAALPEGSQIASGQILWFSDSTTAGDYRGWNFPIYFGETLYLSKNQASAPVVILFFDFS